MQFIHSGIIKNVLSIFSVTLLICFTILLTGQNANIQAIETAKVEVIGGVPRVTIDGVPTTLRPFRGGSNPSLFLFDSQPVELSETFLCTEDVNGKGTILLSFAAKPEEASQKFPIEFYWDNVKITEVDTGRTILGLCDFKNDATISPEWTSFSSKKNEPVGSLLFSPHGGKDNSGALMFRMTKPTDDLWPQHLLIQHRHDLDFKKGKKYRLQCWCRATSPLRVGINTYLPGNPYLLAGVLEDRKNDPLVQQVSLAAQYGFNQVVVGPVLPWPKNGEDYDFSRVDHVIDLVLKANPQALLILWFGCDPPIWWLDENKDHEEVLQGSTLGMRYKKRSVAISSPLYVKELCKHLRATIAHTEKKYGAHIIGYQPCAQNTWEWFYQGVVGSNAFPGFAPIDRIEWNRWLTEKYKTNENLQKAWRSTRHVLGQVDIPSLELRRKGQKEILLDVALDPEYRFLNDYNEFLQKVMSRAIRESAKAAKEACEFKKLVTYFYGYYFHFSAYRQGSAATGHLDLESLLDSPYLDGFAAPYAYGDRDRGGAPTQMTPPESMLLHNKIFIVEDDMRTHRVKNNPNQSPLTAMRDLTDTTYGHQRNTSAFIIRNYNCWYVDLGKDGWLYDPGIWKNLRQISALDRYFLEHPVPYRPDIAVFCGTESLRTVPNTLFTGPTISQACWLFTRIGIPAGQYILADYLSGKTNAKVNILSAAWHLTAQDRKILRKKADTDTIIWAFASAWLDAEEGGSVRFMNEAMPFKVKKITNSNKPLQLTEFGKNAGIKLEYESGDYPYSAAFYYKMKPGQKRSHFGFRQIPNVFTVEDARPEEVLVRYAEGSPAIVQRKMPGGGYSIFLGFPAMPQEIIHLAARAANVPIYTSQRPVFFANDQMIVLHGSKENSDIIHLQLPKKTELFDFFNKKPLGKKSAFDLPLDWGTTRVLLTDPPAELIQPAFK